MGVDLFRRNPIFEGDIIFFAFVGWKTAFAGFVVDNDFGGRSSAGYLLINLLDKGLGVLYAALTLNVHASPVNEKNLINKLWRKIYANAVRHYYERTFTQLAGETHFCHMVINFFLSVKADLSHWEMLSTCLYYSFGRLCFGKVSRFLVRQISSRCRGYEGRRRQRFWCQNRLVFLKKKFENCFKIFLKFLSNLQCYRNFTQVG